MGTPFALGDGPTVLTVPAGATRLEMGNNDVDYSDNVGSWSIQVSGPAAVSASAPEPATPLLLMGATSLLAMRRRRAYRGV